MVSNSGAASSKAVDLMLINCLLFLPLFIFLLVLVWLFCCKALVNHSCLLNRRLYKRPRYRNLAHLIAAVPISTLSALINTQQRLRRYFFCIYEYEL